MTGNIENYLSLTNFQGGSVAFGNRKNREIVSFGKVGKSVSHDIKNIYYVLGLKHNLLSISQMCEKENNMLLPQLIVL